MVDFVNIYFFKSSRCGKPNKKIVHLFYCLFNKSLMTRRPGIELWFVCEEASFNVRQSNYSVMPMICATTLVSVSDLLFCNKIRFMIQSYLAAEMVLKV